MELSEVPSETAKSKLLESSPMERMICSASHIAGRVHLLCMLPLRVASLSAASSLGSRYKSYIEWDRLLCASEFGYASVLAKMHPLTCTPKNDMLFGLPAAAAAIEQLD